MNDFNWRVERIRDDIRERKGSLYSMVSALQNLRDAREPLVEAAVARLEEEIKFLDSVDNDLWSLSDDFEAD